VHHRTSCGCENPSAGAGSVPGVDEREAETSICSLVVADDADCCKVIDGTYTVALRVAVYQNQDIDCCEIAGGVQFR